MNPDNLRNLLYRQTIPGFIVIAHRGASFHTPENTMPAFKKAHELGADMIELDILLTRDLVPVVFHDARLNKKTDGTGFVRDHMLKDIKGLEAGSWFHPVFAGTRIPTLEEVLQWAAGKIALNIEIKKETVGGEDATGAADSAVKLVREYRMENHVIFSSFSYRVIERLKRFAPEIRCGLLYTRDFRGDRNIGRFLNKYLPDTFHCHWRQLNRHLKQVLKERNIPLFVYTVNSEENMRRTIKAGADGIFTDKPDLLRRVAIKLLAEEST
ncbi:MAG: glycerophosphodiester phosphodiesterase family protein [Balneolaceae bacterium]